MKHSLKKLDHLVDYVISKRVLQLLIRVMQFIAASLIIVVLYACVAHFVTRTEHAGVRGPADTVHDVTSWIADFHHALPFAANHF